MRGFQCLLFCVLLYSASVEVFGQLECDEDGDCPDNATCEDVDGEDLCVCGADFDAVDVPGLTIGGTAVTVCIDLGVCSPLDNEVDDCGVNGQCVIFQNEYGLYEAACKCVDGYYGELCDTRIPYTRMTTTSTATTSTTKRSGIGPIIPLIGGGALLLALLAGGAAALASSSG
uniref:EGF-like domain-containing protein n=1 Tax=Magallana gigas TaxID=29159 RepID=A0A8W8LNA3_MAGGI|nr:protein crumbs homolog 1-like [Crassostrea gigas]